jgi:DNA-binding LytR/AlgR family response regulator
MKAIIIDDDLFFCKLLTGFCEKTKIEVLQTFQNPIDGLTYLNENEVDVAFLDFHMPDLNGFDILKNVTNTKFILMTLDETKAVEAFDYDVVDFLLKPVDFTRFMRAVQRLKKSMPVSVPVETETTSSDDSPEFVYVNINKRLVKIALESIDFVQANGNYVKVARQKEEDLMVHTSLKKIAQKLPPNVFHQVHRSYIVNINKIVDIEDSSIVIGRNVIPIGKEHRAKLLDRLHLLN